VEKEQVGQKVFGDSFYSLLLVVDTQDNVFGAFLTHPLRVQASDRTTNFMAQRGFDTPF
jgi:hypothetical protein